MTDNTGPTTRHYLALADAAEQIEATAFLMGYLSAVGEAGAPEDEIKDAYAAYVNLNNQENN